MLKKTFARCGMLTVLLSFAIGLRGQSAIAVEIGGLAHL
jgi:hypothetical protein